jgi:hypothetical protein
MALAETGASADAVARRLGLPADLVRAALDHAERLGLAGRYGTGAAPSGCAGCPTAGTARAAGEAVPRSRLSCAGCPLARR